MKAIIIADNDLVIDNVKQVLKSRSYDTIVYRWLLKALDNLEEIAPHLIVVSQADYPRHWKTITQFAHSGISGFFPQVILYVKDDFSDEEREKAEALGVRGFFSSVDVEGLDELREILDKEDDIYSGEEVKVAEEEVQVLTVEELISQRQAEETPYTSESPIVDEPEIEEPIMEEAITEEPVIEESIVEEAITEEPFAQEKPIVDEPIIEEPVMEEAITEEPVMEETIIEDSFAQEEPVVDEPIIEEPVMEEAIIEEPMIEETIIEDSEIEVPVMEEAIIEEPIIEKTITEEPVAQDEPIIEEEVVQEKPIIEEQEIDNETASEEKSSSEGVVDDYVSPFGKIDYDTIFDDDAGDGYEHISFMFTNPITGCIVTGTTSQFNGSSMEFLPDFGEATEGLELGKEIPFCSMKRGNEVKDVSAQVTDRTADGLMLFIKEK